MALRIVRCTWRGRVVVRDGSHLLRPAGLRRLQLFNFKDGQMRKRVASDVMRGRLTTLVEVVNLAVQDGMALAERQLDLWLQEGQGARVLRSLPGAVMTLLARQHCSASAAPSHQHEACASHPGPQLQALPSSHAAS